MAAINTVRIAMVTCGLDDVAHFQGRTVAQRFASDIFSDNYDNVRKKTMEELNEEIESFAQLPANGGRVRLQLLHKKKIKAFVQWVKDETRKGRDPSLVPFPVAQEADLLRRIKEHKEFVDSSKLMVKLVIPPEYTNDMDWDDFDTKFIGYLRLIPGVGGVPLVYVIRLNPVPDPTQGPTFLEEYIKMAPLVGQDYALDNQKVYTLFCKYVLTNTRAEGAIKAANAEGDGRAVYFAVKVHFEGQGMMKIKVLNAERTIRDLFYAGEKRPSMWWTKFEQELNKAYAIMDTTEMRHTFSDAQKLRALQLRIVAEFLQPVKESINANIAKGPIAGMTYHAAMNIYRNVVQQKTMNTGINRNNPTRRGVAEINQGRGRGGNGGRGRGRGHSRNRNDRHNTGTGNRNHPDQETIILRNGDRISYHPSYNFSRQEFQQMTDGQRQRLRNERAAYREREGLPPRRAEQQAQALTTLRAEVASLRTVIEDASRNGDDVPEDISATGAQSRISQVTMGSITRGRNRQAESRNQGRNI